MKDETLQFGGMESNLSLVDSRISKILINVSSDNNKDSQNFTTFMTDSWKLNITYAPLPRMFCVWPSSALTDINHGKIERNMIPYIKLH